MPAFSTYKISKTDAEKYKHITSSFRLQEKIGNFEVGNYE
jgi:hypothetical protein